MKLVYGSNKVETICTSKDNAKKYFGGDELLCINLLATINALEQAKTIKDIIVQPSFHFHKLTKKKNRDLSGYFAIDLKTRKESWRIILRPLDGCDQPYYPCHIDKIANCVTTIEIAEVSKHYE